MIYNNILLFISSTLCYNINTEQILYCKLPESNSSNNFDQFDILAQNSKYATIKAKNINEEESIRNLVECSSVDIPLNEHLNKYHSSNLESDDFISDNPISDDEFFKNYRSYHELRNKYRYWAKKYPKYAKFVSCIGKSHQGRDLFAIEITGIEPNENKKNILYTSGQHAREWISPATVAFITQNMLKDAESDIQVKDHLNSFIYRIVPMVNPDGYEYSRTNKRMWRKNRRDNRDGSFGVDLNRNWDYKWSKVKGSNSTSSNTYYGPYAASEPEVQSVVNYTQKFSKAYGAIDWHSSGQVIGFNWGWTLKKSSNHEILQKIGRSIAEAFNAHNVTFTSKPSAALGMASGSADDYFGVKLEAVSLTIELCPGKDEKYGHNLPAERIIHCAAAAYSGHKKFSQQLIENPNIPPIKDMPLE
jgi:carboxypeptidase A1